MPPTYQHVSYPQPQSKYICQLFITLTWLQDITRSLTESQLTPLVQQLLKGIQKEASLTKRIRPCLPITPDIMTRIGKVLTKQPSPYQSIMLWAACCTAFFGFLRVSEFTVPSQQSYNPLFHLSLSDIALDNRHSPTTVRLHSSNQKQIPLEKVHTFTLLKQTNKFVLCKQLPGTLTSEGGKKGHCLSLLMAQCSQETRLLQP